MLSSLWARRSLLPHLLLLLLSHFHPSLHSKRRTQSGLLAAGGTAWQSAGRRGWPSLGLSAGETQASRSWRPARREPCLHRLSAGLSPPVLAGPPPGGWGGSGHRKRPRWTGWVPISAQPPLGSSELASTSSISPSVKWEYQTLILAPRTHSSCLGRIRHDRLTRGHQAGSPMAGGEDIIEAGRRTPHVGSTCSMIFNSSPQTASLAVGCCDYRKHIIRVGCFIGNPFCFPF